MTTEISDYEDFFQRAFGNEPFGFQKELANENTDLPSLLKVPTGAGKTNAVLGAWLWRRLKNPATVGRRLIYCLPMRTLVEQTTKVAETAIENLNLKERIGVHVLYGGEVSDDWDIFPEREQIIIGTQDLLLSRALNRGYAMNRFRWAFHFGLFNNDCLWVFDEVQLFGDGLATTAQLQAFRENQEKFGTFGKAKSLWMSATLDRDWLKTVDFKQKVDELQELTLSETDKENEVLSERLNAVKNLKKAEIKCRLPKGLADFVAEHHEDGTQTLIVVNTVQRAQEVFAELEKLYPQENEIKQSAESPLLENQTKIPKIKLLHSRFRPAERKKWREIFNKQFDKNGTEKTVNRIIVATQVVEAGVDISSKLLITDIAPFSSLVQRFGRCNRNAEHENAGVFWIDLPLKEKDKGREYSVEENFENIDEKKFIELAKPYEIEGLKRAKVLLETLESVSLNVLEEVEKSLKESDNLELYTPNHVLRQRDLIDLFDTTADLSGFDLDVSRFVRGGEERDVSFYWRENAEAEVNKIRDAVKQNEARETKRLKVSQENLRKWNKELSPDREELCSVALYRAKEFLKNKSAWTFDALRKEFVKVDANNLRTGMIILLDVKEGGYNNKEGWNGRPAKKAIEKVENTELPNIKERGSIDESVDDDEQTFETQIEEKPDGRKKFISYTQTLTAHSLEVRQAATDILDKLEMSDLEQFRDQIINAAHHHDLGKAHPVFQATVHKIGKEVSLENYDFGEILAKAKSGGKHRRSTFRHELASALALLQRNIESKDGKKHEDLEIYLVAAHHGKVRLSIRALPDENKPKDDEGNFQPERKFARGIWENDKLPETDLGNGIKFPAQTLSLNALSLGRTGDESSWLERMINLREDLGIFRLAYLEAVVRAADVQASAKPIDILPEIRELAGEQNSLEINEND